MKLLRTWITANTITVVSAFDGSIISPDSRLIRTYFVYIFKNKSNLTLNTK